MGLLEGERGEFVCQVATPADAPAPSRLYWKRADVNEPLPSGMYDDGNGKLIISSARSSMVGEYACYINEAPITAKAAFTVAIEDVEPTGIPYIVRVSKEQVELKEGGSDQVTCTALTPADAPSPKGLVWSLRGAARLPDGVFDDGRGTLTFNRAKASHAGTYFCDTRPQNPQSRAILDVSFSDQATQGWYGCKPIYI